MSARRGWLGLVLLAVVVIAALALWRVSRTATGEGETEVASEVPVHVGAVTRATLHGYVAALGTVEPEPAHDGRPAAGARVGSPVTGLVAAVNCSEGRRVAKGDLLVRLDTRLADAQVAKGTEAVSFAELAVARQKKMSSADATSQRAVEEAEQQLAAARSELAAAQAERELLLVRAPLDGTVVRLGARPGDAVDSTTVLAEVVDLDRLVVVAGIPSAEARLLKAGQPVLLAGASREGTPAGPGAPAGTLDLVGVQVDARNDTVPVRVALSGRSGLLPGAVVDVRIVVATHPDCLAVPEDAVVANPDGGAAVAVVEGDKAVLTPVTTGLRDAGLVEVEKEGLKEGTPIVVEGAYGLPKETRIKPVGP